MAKDYIEFQDNSTPLAYFISFRCYGTWFHGDERGSMDRRKYNRFGTPDIPATPKWHAHETPLLKNRPIALDERQRPVVENAVREVCLHRQYFLYAIQARSNHIHSVVSAGDSPEKVMGSFKSYATRQLREKELVERGVRIWSRHGSTKYLWNEKQIELAVEYVINCQGEELPRFE